MNKITINGKTYPLEVDGFGVVTIYGITVDEFLDTLPAEDIEWLAVYGLKTAVDDPEYFEDIAERVEMPLETKELIEGFIK